MPGVPEIKSLLLKIQRTYAYERGVCIGRVQDIIWDEIQIDDEEFHQFLSDLAYNLNFYEQESRDREEEPGYYGDEKLNVILGSALERIETYLAKG